MLNRFLTATQHEIIVFSRLEGAALFDAAKMVAGKQE